MSDKSSNDKFFLGWDKWHDLLMFFVIAVAVFLVFFCFFRDDMKVYAAEPPVITKGSYHFSFIAWQANIPDTGKQLIYYDYAYTTPYPVYAWKEKDGDSFQVKFCMYDENRQFVWFKAIDGFFINHAIYRIYQPHNKEKLIAEYNYSNDYTSGRGLISYVSYIYSDSDFSVSCPLFESLDAIKNYIATGDTSGQIIEDPRNDAVDTMFGLRGFQCNGGYSFSWNGLMSKTSAGTLNIAPGKDDFIDVFIGYGSIDKKGVDIEEKSIAKVYPAATLMVSKNGVSYSKSSLCPDSMKYVDYIKFVPYHYQSLDNFDSSIVTLCRGLESVAYFDIDGNFESYDGHFGDKPIGIVVPQENENRNYFDMTFHTGIDFVDLILNGMVAMLNRMLSVAYDIRDLLFNRGVGGIFQLIEDILYYTNPIHLPQLLMKATGLDVLINKYIITPIEALLATLFIPREGYFDKYFDVFMTHFPGMDKIFGYKDSVLHIFTSLVGVPPVIDIPLSKTWLAKYGVRDMSVSFEWFLPYRIYFQGIVSAYVSLRFMVDQFFGLKSLINGVASSSDTIISASNYWGW